MLAVVAVGFVRREWRGAAVQCGGKNRYLLTWQDSIKEQDADFPSRLPALCFVLPHMNTVFEAHCLLMFQQQQGLCEMPSWVVVPFSPLLYNIPGQKVLNFNSFLVYVSKVGQHLR